jgi:hypothetical protein
MDLHSLKFRHPFNVVQVISALGDTNMSNSVASYARAINITNTICIVAIGIILLATSIDSLDLHLLWLVSFVIHRVPFSRQHCLLGVLRTKI